MSTPSPSITFTVERPGSETTISPAIDASRPAVRFEDAFGDELFDVIVLASDEPDLRNAVQQVVADRWSANESLFGSVFYAVKGNLGDLTATYGLGTNDTGNAYTSVLAVEEENPHAAYEIAAAAAGQIFKRYLADPVLSYNNIVLAGITGPSAVKDRFNTTARQTLLNDARLSTIKYGGDNIARLESVPIRWKPAGGGFYYLSNLFTVTFVGRIFANMLERYISDFKFFDDTGSPSAVPNGAIALSTIRGELAAQYERLVTEGIVEDAAGFNEGLQVYRDVTVPSRLHIVLPINIQNAIRQIQAVISWSQ